MSDFETFMYNMSQDLEARFGMFGLFIPLLVTLGGLLLFYLIVIKTYGGFQRKRYGFRMFINWPGLVVMGCYSIAFLLEVLDSADTVEGLLLVLLAVGAPGMICYAIKCLRETRSIVITVINTVLMYILYMVLGWVLGFIIFAVFVLLGIVLLISALASPDYYVCGSCGHRMRGKHDYCPNCGS